MIELVENVSADIKRKEQCVIAQFFEEWPTSLKKTMLNLSCLIGSFSERIGLCISENEENWNAAKPWLMSVEGEEFVTEYKPV